MSKIKQDPEDFANRYAAAAVGLFDSIEAACAAAPDWPRGVRSATRSALAFLASDPDTATLLLFEPYAVGRKAQLRHEATLARLADLLRAGRERVGAESLPGVLEEGLVGGAAFIVLRPLRVGEADLLPALGPELTALLLSPYLGREQAERVAFETPGA